MTRNKGRAMTVVSVLNDRQRVAAFVMLLLTADKQTAPNRNRSKKAKIKNKDKLVRKKCGPCFYWYVLYPVLIDSVLSKRDRHDRYHRAHVNQRIIQDHRT